MRSWSGKIQNLQPIDQLWLDFLECLIEALKRNGNKVKIPLCQDHPVPAAREADRAGLERDCRSTPPAVELQSCANE
jgi:hypothetical protein